MGLCRHYNVSGACGRCDIHALPPFVDTGPASRCGAGRARAVAPAPAGWRAGADLPQCDNSAEQNWPRRAAAGRAAPLGAVWAVAAVLCAAF